MIAGAAFALGAGVDPSQLLPAREQMGFTLGFHIILVPFGVAFTFITMIANWRAIRRNDADALVLAQRWSKVAAVLFAVGAVSGTVLSFEMGLLWPGLMNRYGAAYGIPFAVEGIGCHRGCTSGPGCPSSCPGSAERSRSSPRTVG